MQITECPRDAMQGIERFIPTDIKIEYLNSLLKVGFDFLDFGSFVSPKAVPQMGDTANVLAGLNLSGTRTRLLAIIANERGAREAVEKEKITFLGYPFSVSETFQIRNTKATIEESLERVKEIQEICVSNDKKLLVYLSMAFGNPYGDEWNPKIVSDYTAQISDLGIKFVALADTVGVSKPDNIKPLFNELISRFPQIEFGAHLHSHPAHWKEKIEAAWEAGCRKFDSAMRGFGGCPMAKDELVGNIATENLLNFLREKDMEYPIDNISYKKSLSLADKVFYNNFEANKFEEAS